MMAGIGRLEPNNRIHEAGQDGILEINPIIAIYFICLKLYSTENL